MGQSRNTIQRQLVLEAVRGMHNHPTADEIHSRLAQSHPTISRATVYRNLSLLAERGEILRVSHLNAADRFDFNLEPHYHFHCRGCGRVFDAGHPLQEPHFASTPDEDGFLYEACAVTFTGLCPQCAKHTSGERHNKS